MAAEITETGSVVSENGDSQEPQSNTILAEVEVESEAPSSNDRMARFKALQARAVCPPPQNHPYLDHILIPDLQKKSAEHNLKEAAAESHRLSTDSSQLTAIARKHATASHNLLKADTEAAGEDFERKRAWDWTIDDSEKWDKRMAKKQRNRDNVYFADHHQEASKVYKRQVRDMQTDADAYKRAKDDAMRRAAESGNLEIVETGDGELVAVDQEGNTFSSAENVNFVEKPDKSAVDRLVNDLKKAEEVRMRKRRERGREQEDGDVTYINDKNKQFNQKLSRFYDKVYCRSSIYGFC